MNKRSNLTWLITGADKGLGYQTAKAALERGDNVIVTVLAADGSHALTSQYPDRLRAFQLDARDHKRFDEFVAEVKNIFDGIDILLNNAGYGLISVAEETDSEKYRSMFEVNFFGLTEMTRAVLPVMRAQRSGHIINLSSLAGFAAAAGFGFYSASKFAVEGYSEALAKEIKQFGIHVTIVEPGGFRSDFAGLSLVGTISKIADYDDLGRQIQEYMTSRHGTQPNDPLKFGKVMCRLADAERPPLRLPLGEDAVQLVREKLHSVTAELEQWLDLSCSTSFDA